MVAAIIGAEIAFWVFVLGGFSLRYIVRAEKASTTALALVPFVDLVLVALVTTDLMLGGEPSRVHAVAAVYLGITVAFGKPIVRRTDQWFRYRFDGGPKPTKPKKGSREEVRALWVEWFRLLFGFVIATICILLMTVFDGTGIPASVEEASGSPFWSTILLMGVVAVIWFLAGPAFAGRGQPRVDTENRATGGR